MGNVESIPKPVQTSPTRLIFGKGAGDSRGLDREDPAVLNCNRSEIARRYTDDPPSPGFTSKCVRRLLTTTCPFFSSSSSCRANSTSSSRQSALWFFFSDSFEPKAHNGVARTCQGTIVTRKTDAGSRRRHKMLFPYTAKPHLTSPTYPLPPLHHHLHQWLHWTNNFRRHLLPLMV